MPKKLGHKALENFGYGVHLIGFYFGLMIAYNSKRTRVMS